MLTIERGGGGKTYPNNSIHLKFKHENVGGLFQTICCRSFVVHLRIHISIECITAKALSYLINFMFATTLLFTLRHVAASNNNLQNHFETNII